MTEEATIHHSSPDPTRRMLVGVLCEFAESGGGEHSLLALAPALRERGFDLVVFAPAGGRLSEDLRSHGVRQVAFSVREDRTTAISRLTQVVPATNVALLHAISLSLSRLTGQLSRIAPLPTTGHLRDILNLSATALDDINHNRVLIAVSEATRRHHVDAGLDGSCTRVVLNGIAPDSFCRNVPPTVNIRQELDIARPRLLVATIGQIGLRKGLDVLAEASHLVEHPLDHVVIGERLSDKEETVRYEQAVFRRLSEASPDYRVHRLGYRDDVAAVLCEVDLLVHPARQEPLGRVLLEAAACGRAIVATDVGGTPEILEHGRSAWLVPPDDPVALAGAIDTLAADGPLRRRLGLAALDHVTRRFSIEAAADGLARAWRDALG